MGKKTKIIVTGIQILLAIVVALFSIDFGDRLMMNLYTEVTGSLPPFAGLPEIYNIGSLYLVGFISAIFAYLILYRVPCKSMIVSAIVLLIFVLYFAYLYKSWGQELSIYEFRYEIILGGLFVITTYEVACILFASNKSFKSTSKDGTI